MPLPTSQTFWTHEILYVEGGFTPEAREQLESILLAGIPSTAKYLVLCFDGKVEEMINPSILALLLPKRR